MTCAEAAEETTDLAALPLERLEAELCTLAGHRNAVTCRWLELIAEFDRRRGFESWGMYSCAMFLSWRCGLSARAAQDKVRVARRIVELSLVREAFRSGSLSYSKVRAISRVATPLSEAGLVELALEATTPQLEDIVREFRKAKDACRPEAERDVRLGQYLRTHRDDDGYLVGSFRIAPDAAAGFEAAVLAELDEVGSSDDPIEVRRAEALVAAVAGDVNVEVVVHAEADVLAGDAVGVADLDGRPISAMAAQRLACQAAVVAMLGEGESLSVGRRTRRPNRAMRRALRRRDGGCRFPGCGRKRRTQAHHIKHWTRGGLTTLSNLVDLCWYHHHVVHEGGWSVELLPGGEVTFRRPDGRVVEEAPPMPKGKVAVVVEEQRSLDIGPETAAARSNGERYDLGLTIDALMCQEGLIHGIVIPNDPEPEWPPPPTFN